MTSPTYDPTSGPTEPGVEQPDPRVGQTGQPGTFAGSQVEYATGGARDYARPITGSADSAMGSSSTADTAKGEAVNVKDTAVDGAAGVKDVAKGEASSVAQEAKYQARSLVDQTGSELRGQTSSQQSALGKSCKRWIHHFFSL